MKLSRGRKKTPNVRFSEINHYISAESDDETVGEEAKQYSPYRSPERNNLKLTSKSNSAQTVTKTAHLEHSNNKIENIRQLIETTPVGNVSSLEKTSSRSKRIISLANSVTSSGNKEHKKVSYSGKIQKRGSENGDADNCEVRRDSSKTPVKNTSRLSNTNLVTPNNVLEHRRVSCLSHNATGGGSVRVSSEFVDDTPDALPNPQILSFCSKTYSAIYSEQSCVKNTNETPAKSHSPKTFPKTPLRSSLKNKMPNTETAVLRELSPNSICFNRGSRNPSKHSIFTLNGVPNCTESDQLGVLPLKQNEESENLNRERLRLEDTQVISSDILQGVVAYVEVRTGGDNRSAGIRAYLQELGATISLRLTKNVTHVIFKEGLMSTYKKAKQWNIPIVSVLWIDECKKRGIQVSERLFPPTDVEQYESPDPLKKLKRVKSFQPYFEDKKKLRKFKVPDNNCDVHENLPDTQEILKRALGSKWDKNIKNGMLNALNTVADLDESNNSTTSQRSEEDSYRPLAARLLDQIQLSEHENRNSNEMDRSLRSQKKVQVEGITPLDMEEHVSNNASNKNDMPSKNRKNSNDSGAASRSPVKNSTNKALAAENSTLSSTRRTRSKSANNELPNDLDNKQMGVSNKAVIQHNGNKKDSALHKNQVNTVQTDVAKENKSEKLTEIRKIKKANISNTPISTRSSPRLASVSETSILVSTKSTVKNLDHKVCQGNIISEPSPPVSSKKGKNLSEMNTLILENTGTSDVSTSSGSSLGDTGNSDETLFGEDKNCRQKVSKSASDGDSAKGFRIDCSQLSQGHKRKLMPMTQPSSPLQLEHAPTLIQDAQLTEKNMIKKRKKIINRKSLHRETSDMDLTNPVPSSSNILTTDAPVSARRSQKRKTSTSNVPRNSKARRSSNQFVKIQKDKQSVKLLPTIVCTALHRHEVEVVAAIVAKLGGYDMENKVTSRTTHVVSSGPKRTVNFLKGIARGCWILKQEWVLKSLEAGKWLDEEKYEVKDFSPAVQEARIEKQAFGPGFKFDVFGSCEPIFVDPKCKPPAEDLEELIQLCGGEVGKFRNSTLIVGRGSYRDNVTCVNENWILDSITENELQPVDEYRLIRNH